jgi:hypothetical protein
VPQSWNRYTYCGNNPLFYTDPAGLLWYLKNGGDGRPEWFDSDPGDGYTKFTRLVYYAGEDHGYVVLDQHRGYWQDGFESEEDARGFSDKLDADERMLKDPPQDTSISGSMSMPEIALIPIPGTGA